uniref:Uncharacterized protein n=1 Tax=Physcomitrium patens TaxID=3218 RepID=A0A7I3Z2A2_PHYPA
MSENGCPLFCVISNARFVSHTHTHILLFRSDPASSGLFGCGSVRCIFFRSLQQRLGDRLGCSSGIGDCVA